MDESSLVSQAVLIIATVRDAARSRELIAARYGLSAKESEEIVAKAFERISLAAIPDLAEEIGKAKSTYERIIELSFENGDAKTALDAQGKLSELLRLKEPGRLTRSRRFWLQKTRRRSKSRPARRLTSTASRLKARRSFIVTLN